jgi:hypothetical protein
VSPEGYLLASVVALLLIYGAARLVGKAGKHADTALAVGAVALVAGYLLRGTLPPEAIGLLFMVVCGSGVALALMALSQKKGPPR